MRLSLFFALACAVFLPRLAMGQTLLIDKPELLKLVANDAKVEKLAGGFTFLEGPVFNVRENCLIFCDTRTSRLYRFDPGANAVKVLRDPSGHTNGDALTADGELLSCEQGAGRVSITRAGGAVETVVDRFEGKRLNAPNDVVVKRDGSIWFTDPTYGMEHAKEQPANHVFRFDPKTREIRAVISDFVQPNGLCFSPDESRLYISDTSRSRHVRVFDVTADGHLANGRVFCQIDNGAPDGIRCDPAGNLFASAGDGVQIFNPAGERLGKILVPETPANLCFGGADGKDLYMTAQTTLYRIRLNP
jgi:gluconolactonase